MSDPQAFLFHLDKAEDSEAACSLTYRFFLEAIAEHDFVACDSVMGAMRTDRFSGAVLASVLTATAGAKRFLTRRQSFFERSLQTLTARYDAEQAADILHDLN